MRPPRTAVVALGIASAALAVPTTTLASWSFVGESVRMQVVEGEFVVDGRYEFERSTGGDDLVLRYPFPADATLGTPELMRACVITPAGPRSMKIAFGPDGWRWILRSSWGRRVSVQIRYRQATLARHATYILTSTRDWGRPLNRAVLEVRLPAEWEVDVSPRLPQLGTCDGVQIRGAEFRDWLPDRDLKVRWRTK